MMAINTLVAHEIGAARHDRVPHIVRQSLWKALLVGLVACLLTNMAALVFDHLMLEPAVAAKAKLFVHIITASCRRSPPTARCTATAPASTRPSP